MSNHPDSNDPIVKKQLAEMTDQSLMRRFRDGADDAATALYLRYAQRLQRLADAQVSPNMAVRMDPEGIVQSVFRTFFRRAASGQYDVAEKEDFWKLLLVIALNKIRSSGTFHRASKRDIQKSQSLPEQVLADRSKEGDELAFNVLKMTIEEVLGAIPEEQRRIVWLRIEGHEVTEIAEKTGRAKRSVERILQAFRKRLSDLVTE